MRQHLLRQFHFSKAERHGVAALLVLAAATFLAPDIYGLFYRRDPVDPAWFADQVRNYSAGNAAPESSETTALFAFDPNTATVETFVRLGLPERVAGSIVKYRDRGGRFREADDLRKIYTLQEADFERLRPYIRIATHATTTHPTLVPPNGPSALFPFDPNTAGEFELLRLGLPKPLVARLLHYREKGGVFADPAGFRKLYGLSDRDFERLEPYIAIVRSDRTKPPAANTNGRAPAGTSVELDINTASTDDWQRLRGIGAVRAQKIVQFRDKLGGFARVEQVAETFGLPDSVFQTIRPQLQMQAPVFRKINLNTATADDIAAHPYFTAKQARLIVAFREQHGPFNSVEALDQIAAFTDRQWIQKVKPYLATDSTPAGRVAVQSSAN